MNYDRPTMAVFVSRATLWFDDGLQHHLREAGAFTTTRSQGLVLGYLALGETRPSRLARAVGISPQAMSQVLIDLTEAKLIETAPDEADGRARVVRLTEDGEKYLDVVRPILLRMEASLEARFSRPVMDVVRMVLAAEWDPPETAGGGD